VTSAQGAPGGDHGRPTFGAGGRFGQSAAEEPEPVVVRDKRRVSPFGAAPGQQSQQSASEESPGSPPGAPPAGDHPTTVTAPEPDEVAAIVKQLEERTADLQRLKAEYDNYRRRVERDRQTTAEQATSRVLVGLLGTLDDIGRAREHGDLDGPFRTVAEALESTLESVGLERYGEVGEPFDPNIHEALVHTFQAGLKGPTCIEIYRAGYRYAGRVLRPAQVVVADPPAPEESADGAT
jgi:molecular chaperone GrpE